MAVYAVPKPSKRAPKAQRSRVRKVNGPRKTREFARAYHSKKYVEFTKSCACIFCGHVGHSETAHAATGGMGRKADWTRTFPACGPHPVGKLLRDGCHALYDQDRQTLLRVTGVDLEAAIARHQAMWAAFQERQ